MTESSSVFFELHERLRHAITHRLRWRELRPVQELTVRATREGCNAIVLAPTAGGKTEASLFGVLDSLLSQPSNGVCTLYLSPLRALLNNQEPRVKELAEMVGLRAFKWHGDVSAQDKAQFVQSPHSILMTTPESLEVILMTARYDQQQLFAGLRFVIIDEIHGFAGDDRGDHLLALLERLSVLANRDFQRIGLSATVGNPELLLDWLQGSSKRVGKVINPLAPRQKKIIEIVPLPEGMDVEASAALLARGKKSLLFADSRSKVEKMKAGLQRSGIRAFPHHGSLSRSLREESEEAFRSGSNCSIVCTSTMELGLDVGDLDIVLQLGAPSTVSAFLQRLGRTGRRTGSTARMTFLCHKPESFLVACSLVSLALKRWIEPITPSRSSYPVFVHQVLATVLGQGGVPRSRLISGVGAPYCFSELTHEERGRILEEMLAQEVLIESDSLLLLGSEGEKRFGRSNFMSLYSVFETPSVLTVRTEDQKEIGQLESWFVQSGDDTLCFLLGGKAWQTLRVDWKRATLYVKPAANGAAPTWMGEPTLLSYEICRQVKELLCSSDEPVFLGQRGLSELARLRNEWRDVVHPARWVFSPQGRNHVSLFTFAGGRVNNVIARYHQHRTGRRTTVDNFYLKTEGSESELRETLDILASEVLDAEALSILLESASRSRLSKFQSCLPKDLEARFLGQRLFDPELCHQLCRANRERRPSRESEVREPRPPTYAASKDQVARDTDDPFVAQLISLVAQEPAANKWVVVPNSRWKHTLGERLLLMGVDWLNLRFITAFELALEVAAPVLLARGIDPCPEGLGPPLIARLFRQLPADTPAHFRPLVSHPRLSESLWAAIRELRLAGISSTELPVETSKHREIRALYQAYENYLEENSVADRATIFQLAVKCAGAAEVGGTDLLLEAPWAVNHLLERTWLDSLPGKRLPTAVGAVAPPRRKVFLSPHIATTCRPAKKARHLLRFVLSSEGVPSDLTDGSLRLFQAGRRDAEYQEILRRLIANHIPVDKVELITANPEDLDLLLDKLTQMGIQATCADGVPVSLSRLGQAVTGILDWVAQDFSAFCLRQLLLSESLVPKGIGPLQAARYLQRSGASWGRETYRSHLKPAALRARENGFEERADRIQALEQWIEELLSGLEEATEDRISPGRLCSFLLHTIKHVRVWHSSLELSARRAVCTALTQLQQLDELPIPVPEAVKQLKDLLEGTKCASQRAMSGHIHICSFSEAGLSGRPHLFVTGLEEGRFLGSRGEDPVLGDRERERLSPALPTSFDCGEEDLFPVLERLSKLDGTVTLSYSCRDMATGETLLPSWLFFSAARLRFPTLSSLQDLNRFIGEPVGLVPDSQAVATQAEWWMTRLKPRGPEAADLAREAFPWLARGKLAQTHRSSEKLTLFDGLVPSLAGVLDPRNTGIPISASRLQDLADCPFRSFLRDGLGIRPVELVQPEPGLWLDPLQRGTLLHDVFADYYRFLRSEGRAAMREDQDLLKQLLDDRLKGLESQLPPCSSSVIFSEMNRLLTDLSSFLQLEIQSEEREPIGFEVGFGLSETYQEPLATEDAIELRLADDLRFSLHGRIDRIDRVAGGLEVIDYKTGHSLARKAGIRFDGGRLIQHALYALVVEKLTGTPVTFSSYYFPVAGAPKSWMRFPRTEEAELALLLRDLLEPLKTGAFLQSERVSVSCRHCDFRPACVGHNEEKARTKLAVNPQLKWRSRLEDLS